MPKKSARQVGQQSVRVRTGSASSMRKTLRLRMQRPGAFPGEVFGPRRTTRKQTPVISRVAGLLPSGLKTGKPRSFLSVISRKLLRPVSRKFETLSAWSTSPGVCAKRAIRREIMHALGVAGRSGVGAGKPRKTNAQSKVRC